MVVVCSCAVDARKSVGAEAREYSKKTSGARAIKLTVLVAYPLTTFNSSGRRRITKRRNNRNKWFDDDDMGQR